MQEALVAHVVCAAASTPTCCATSRQLRASRSHDVVFVDDLPEECARCAVSAEGKGGGNALA
jgi:hypothetical protein